MLNSQRQLKHAPKKVSQLHKHSGVLRHWRWCWAHLSCHYDSDVLLLGRTQAESCDWNLILEVKHSKTDFASHAMTCEEIYASCMRNCMLSLRRPRVVLAVRQVYDGLCRFVRICLNIIEYAVLLLQRDQHEGTPKTRSWCFACGDIHAPDVVEHWKMKLTRNRVFSVHPFVHIINRSETQHDTTNWLHRTLTLDSFWQLWLSGPAQATSNIHVTLPDVLAISSALDVHERHPGRGVFLLPNLRGFHINHLTRVLRNFSRNEKARPMEKIVSPCFTQEFVFWDCPGT